MNNRAIYVDGLVLGERGSDNVDELKDLFDGGKDGRVWFERMITCLLDDILVIEDFMRH